jgi:hypothetical protein
MSLESNPLSDYLAVVAKTDKLPRDVTPVLYGLYGEVGSVMATAKKHIREGAAYPTFRESAREEFGDALWYLAALCRRLDLDLSKLLLDAAEGLPDTGSLPMFDGTNAGISKLDAALFSLGRSTADLLRNSIDSTALLQVVRDYLAAINASDFELSEIVRSNLVKTRGAFIDPEPSALIDFDARFDRAEQLPRTFRVRIQERSTGKSYLQWNDVFIGDALTDNIRDRDGYRFHDVFHFAHAAILHWSPVVRALIKQKRKSDPCYDENEDGGRAIVIEEGLTAWLFARSKALNYFEGQNQVSLGILKTIQDFVAGYEVAKCPLKLWERAILDGYAVFRELRAARGGWIVGDRTNRSIRYESL